MNSGKQSKFFVSELLNDVITNNNKNINKLIAVIFNTYNTTDTNEISNIQNQLENKDYNVSLKYDSKGYVSGIIIKD